MEEKKLLPIPLTLMNS